MRDEFGRQIDVCPICDSTDVRWRGRRPWDFAFTWLRWLTELFASVLRTNALDQEWSIRARTDFSSDMLEANTGLKTPKRFWKCRACKRKGHVFA